MFSSRSVRSIPSRPPKPLRLVPDDASEKELPPNPVIPDGVRLLYFGLLPRRIVGMAAGNVYYVDHTRRTVDVAPADVQDVLTQRAFNSTVTVAAVACAWRITSRSASCTIRSAARAVSNGGAGSLPRISSDTARLLPRLISALRD